ncbi:GNAT family N-acetyltransferase [Halomonas stenophila]|uniref:Putative GNAT family N-acyltransferase n=1 Tax=Halomonas stenophila TaxID=795312 RepID=A0A7W5EQ16_9GAMM|nr:GNAT family N-acetyltransferase [Halomonas stenophila]MBB3229354.1 putative GNAT family N-acyltransferase [Halomonas stenophila]
MKETELAIEEGGWDELGAEATQIRRIVFIEEQAVPRDEEWDGRDPDCVHFLAWHDGVAVGTARLLPDGHIGRVAVLEAARGLGIGVALMEAAIEAARRRGFAAVELAAQTHALAFYERLGFRAEGEVFLEAGIPHRNMVRRLSD